MELSKIIDCINENECVCSPTNVFIFEKDAKGSYDDVIHKLSQQGFRLLDVNQQVAECSDDFDISASEAGFSDESGKVTIGDLILNEEKKKSLVMKVKLNRLEKLIDSRTVLLITYNDLFLQSKRLYETIRSWLKDGYCFHGTSSDIPLQALIYLETDHKINDFCLYGIKVQNNASQNSNSSNKGALSVTPLCITELQNYDDNDSRYRLANEILYAMVRKYPRHDNDDEIVAKIWTIGRTYAAAIERRQNKANTPGDFYYDHVAPKIKERGDELDNDIQKLSQESKITEKNIPQILELHKKLTGIFNGKTGKDNRSLASKYLHFHLPNLFFIYDSRAESVITSFSGKLSKNLKIPNNCDITYAKFFYKAFQIYQYIDSQGTIYSDTLPRVIDNLLLRFCDKM